MGSVPASAHLAQVYFKIDKHRAFVAHINAYKPHPTQHRVNLVNQTEGKALKEEVMDRLRRNAAEKAWDPTMVDKESVIIICPSPQAEPYGSSPHGQKRTGEWVIDGIREFLGLSTGTVVDVEHEGFVVNHVTGDVFRVPYPEVGDPVQWPMPPSLKAYDAKKEPCAAREWTILVTGVPSDEEDSD
ncbi:hypothetical protein LTR85_002582 [Meristemomyces frigidus]|nr:hypothetical protein LTR85_002582 [Meristemomyces frigidus]